MHTFRSQLMLTALACALLLTVEAVEAVRPKFRPAPPGADSTLAPREPSKELPKPYVPKSPSTAAKLSVWTTLGSLPTVVLAAPGIIVGPSTGFFYGGRPGRAWLGIGLRTIGMGAMIGTFAASYVSSDESGLRAIGFIAGGALTFGSAIADMVTVKGEIR